MSIEMWAALLGIAVIFPTHAVERVAEFHSDIRVSAEGELTVTETFEVHAEAKEARRGIVREFPLAVPLQVTSVTRNRQAEPYAVERAANATRLRIGEAGRALPPGRHVYEINYRSSRQIGFLDKHDQLHWHVNGTAWSFGFDRLTAEVTFERPVPAGELKVHAWTGKPGPRGNDFNAFVRDGSAAFRSSRPLAPREGMAILIAFPKGVVAPPSILARTGRFLSSNSGASSGVAALALMLGVLCACWWHYGRESATRLGPAGVRFVDQQSFDDRCLSAALLELASRGYLRIRELEDRFRVERTGKEVDWLPGEQALARRLLPGDLAHLEIEKRHDKAIEEARDAFAAALRQHFGRRYWSSNAGYIALGAAIGILGIMAMIVLEAPAPAMAWVCGLMLATLLVFSVALLPVYSAPGRKLRNEIDGLRQYLSASPQTHQEFSRFLPYAVALGVEKTWSERFAAVLGAAALVAAVSEFYESSLHDFSDSISSMGETIASASTPPAQSPVADSLI
jgi:predicted membrane protein DUF2207